MEKFEEMAWSDPKDYFFYGHNADLGLILDKMQWNKDFFIYLHIWTNNDNEGQSSI